MGERASAVAATDLGYISHKPNPETEDSLQKLAANKAQQITTALPGALVIATDGGLLVPALGAAWDPLRTRRFAGLEATNRERADALLTLAAGLDGEERQIGWREAMAVARDGKILSVWTAESAPGLLARDYDPALLDAAGFWVPALWLCPEYDHRRLAALADAERTARDDHWAGLGRELRRFLAALPEDEA